MWVAIRGVRHEPIVADNVKDAVNEAAHEWDLPVSALYLENWRDRNTEYRWHYGGSPDVRVYKVEKATE